MRLLKLIGILVDYPADEFWQSRAEILDAIDDPSVPVKYQTALNKFVLDMLNSDPIQIQSEWIETFDRGRNMSLLMFEHIHGESRDRGQAMVDLINAYEAEGFQLNAKELPDYLPLILEFLSFQKPAFVKEWLETISYFMALLATRAKARDSRYEVLFNILVELAGNTHDWQSLSERVADEEPDNTPEAMDAVWMEEEVKFGPGQGIASTSDCNPNGVTQRRRISPRNKKVAAQQEAI